MSTVPAFWTRIVILIDTNPTPLPAIQSYLEWSRDVPLHVAVMRKPGTLEDNDPGEKARVAAVMDLLGPHVHRWRSLLFDVIYSSSLPSLRRDFHGVASALKGLGLKCRVDDSGNDASNIVGHGAFRCPVLETLIIDCHNFVDSCMIDAQPFNHVEHIEIFQSSRSEGADESLSLYAVLRTLQKFLNLRSLTVSDVKFDFASGSYPVSSFFVPDSLAFKDLSGELLAEFFLVTGARPYSTMITHCSITMFNNITSCDLTLESIAADQDLTEFLGEWHGYCLDIQNCPGFNDNVLARMGEASSLSGNFGAPNMYSLCIVDCSNFSVGALRKMIDARCRSAPVYEHEDYSDDDFSDPSIVSRIDHLSFRGCGPSISSTDIEWFRANVEFFSLG